MRLVENRPLDLDSLAELLGNRDDLSLVWPAARYPFDANQWREALDPAEGHISFWVAEGDATFGHAALCATQTPGCYAVSYLYLHRNLRGQGRGRRLLGLLEGYARDQLRAHTLTLVVRDDNHQGVRCYGDCGFRPMAKEGSLISMSKLVSPAEGPAPVSGGPAP
jgi:GNAT superfamily N-acetyltransferase